MFASIKAAGTKYSGEEPSESRGKFTTVRSNEFVLRTHRDEIEIRATCSQDEGSGERGGTMKTIKREVVITLERSELQKIFKFAMKHRLISAPGGDAVSNAIKQLQHALSDMNYAS